MATPGDGSAPYENVGAGGKFRKRPSRRSTPATPYARPPTAVRNNNPSMLKKLVDPASRLIYAGAHRLFDVFRKSLSPLSLGPPEINEEPLNVLHKEGGNGNSASVSAVTGISELELMLQQKSFTRSEIQRLTSLLHSKTNESASDDSPEKHVDTRVNCHAAVSTPAVTSRVVAEEIANASPAELAKYYMESRPTSQAPRPDSKLLPRTPVVQITANSLRNFENGLVTPRSRGRSAMYTMARTPYSKSPLTFSKQALKRRSSVLDDDIGSGGPLRRIRQKANLLSQRDEKEVGYPVFQPPGLVLTAEPKPKLPKYASVPAKSTQTAEKILQHLDKPSPIGKGSVSTTIAGMREKSPNKLRLDMLHGQALRSLDSPKFLYDIQKPELTLQSKDETQEENGLRKFPPSHNMVNNDTLKGKSPITDFPLEEEPQKKHAFQMSAPEDSFELDNDDDDDIHDNGYMSLENNKSETSAAIIIKTPTLVEVSKTPEIVGCNKPVLPEVSELKEAESDISTPKTDSVCEQGLAFKIPNSSPLATTTQTNEIPQSTLLMENIPLVKVLPFSFSANEPSVFKPNADAGSNPKEIDSTSVFNSVTKNDHVKFSVFNKDENGDGSDDKSKSMFIFPTVSTATPANGIFSFGKNLDTPNITPASLAPSASTTTAISTITTAPAAIFSTSVSPQAFSFGSATLAAPTTSVAETGNTSIGSSFVATTTRSGLFGFSSPAVATSTTTIGSGLFGFSSPAAATSTATTTTESGLFSFSSLPATTTTESGLFGFSSPAAATSTTTTTARTGLFGFSSPAPATTITTATGSDLLGFSSPVTATSTSTTNASGLFGFNSPAPATSTTTTNASGLFGFNSPAPATSTTTTNTSGLFGFNSPAPATSTTTANASGLFGFSSPAAAASTTTTTTASGLFGISSPATATSTITTTGSGLFGFSSPVAATSTTINGSGLFGFSSSAAASASTTNSQSQGSFFNISNGSANASSTSSLFGSSIGSSSCFGVGPPTSDTKSTTSIFGSTWQQSSGFGSTFNSSTPSSTFTFGAAASTPVSSFATASVLSVFGNSTPVFGGISATSPNINNDQMSMEDSMAEDSMQTQSPPVSPFGVSAPGFMFGGATPSPVAVPFSFGNQAAPPQNPFQSSSVEFNAGGGSFSLGSGGEKSNRRIVRVMKSKNRKK